MCSKFRSWTSVIGDKNVIPQVINFGHRSDKNVFPHVTDFGHRIDKNVFPMSQTLVTGETKMCSLCHGLQLQ